MGMLAVAAVLLVYLCITAAQQPDVEIVACSGSCNGHASGCSMNTTGEEVCECEDRTTGPMCAECQPFHQDRPWEPATPDDNKPCIACNCNNHSTECTFDLQIYIASGNVSGGVCINCQHNTEGTNCDRCSLGYHRDLTLPLSSENACTLCPGCFDQVAVLFNETVQQYQELLLRVNRTSEGGAGLSSETIRRLEDYERLLKDLLEIAENVTQREPQLLVDVMAAANEANSYGDLIDQFAANVSEAENATARLNVQVNESVVLLQQLQSIVAMIENSLRNETRLKIDEAFQLVEESITQFELLVNLSSEANVTAAGQESTAHFLLTQAMQALNFSTEAFDLLCLAISLQNDTTAILDMIEEDRLPLLERLYAQGLQALMDAERDVPLTLNQSREVLERVQSLIIPEYNVTLLQRDVTDLENQTNLLLNSTLSLNSEVQELRTNFSELSARAERLLEESRNLTSEVTDLQLRVHGANSDAMNSAEAANATFERANGILEELLERLESAEDFASGLMEVIRNVERAENYSGLAEAGAEQSAMEIRQAVQLAAEAAKLLNETANRLEEALATAMQTNATASVVLDDATTLNSSSHDLASNVTVTERTVTMLEEQANRDKENIAAANASAHDAISTSREVQTRIVELHAILMNLTQELNATTLLPPERLESINTTVSSFEERLEENWVVVDELSEQVRLLEESSEELRRRYVELQQHRDLLQEILDNIDELNCRAQFV